MPGIKKSSNWHEHKYTAGKTKEGQGRPQGREGGSWGIRESLLRPRTLH